MGSIADTSRNTANTFRPLSELKTAGAEAPLRSTHPPLTPSAWPSLYTGTDPSHHGVYGFFTYDDYPDTLDHINDRTDVRQPALWNYLTELGRTSVVLNMPMTHPAEPIEGVIVPGYPAPEATQSYPSTIRDTLDTEVGDYRIYPDGELSENPQTKLEAFLHAIQLREHAASHLLTTRDWDLAVVQVQKTDTVFHHFGPGTEAKRIYAAADRLVSTLLDVISDDVNVIICSDHGMGPKRHQIDLNMLLHEWGYLPTELGTRSDRLTTGSLNQQLRRGDSADTEDTESNPTHNERPWTTRAADTLQRIGVEPTTLIAVAHQLGLGPLLQRLTPDDTQRVVDYRAARAFATSGQEWGIRLNIEGRESEGVVPPAEAEQVRDALVSDLREVTTPDGTPVFESVHPREDVFDGPHITAAPDILLIPRDDCYLVADEAPTETHKRIDDANHVRDGVFIATGPEIRSDWTPTTLDLTDVAPLAMACLGEAVPERMTGTVPDGLFDGTVRTRAYWDISFAERERTDADGRTLERLRDLGYR